MMGRLFEERCKIAIPRNQLDGNSGK